VPISSNRKSAEGGLVEVVSDRAHVRRERRKVRLDRLMIADVGAELPEDGKRGGPRRREVRTAP
jgi:hypothetical protein